MSYVNKYPGKCFKCDRWVEAGKGIMVLSGGGGDWRVYCCPEHQPGYKAPFGFDKK